MCDDALMQAYPTKVIRGVEVLLHICGAERAIIAIEDDKKESIELLRKFCKNERITIESIPTKYTSGAEKILVKLLLGIEIPSGGYASDVGVLCQNVGTLVAIFDAVVENRPLISRVVTVTGSAVKEPKNFQVRLGASYDYVLGFADIDHGENNFRMAGMMMGVDLEGSNYSISKNTNCIFVNKVEEKTPAQECIRCGMCNTVCPVELLPQQLYWYSKSSNIEKALDYNLMDCIECGCCSYVCPSNIPLVDYFQFAKALNRQQAREKEQTDNARERFEFRELRLERNKKERGEMMEAKKKSLKEKMAKDKAQKEAIAAAQERVAAAKAAKESENAS
jgi:electron transport complex protein RnfC